MLHVDQSLIINNLLEIKNKTWHLQDHVTSDS